MIKQLKKINWSRISLFYGAILVATYLVRKLPNLLSEVTSIFTTYHLPWNYNHGFAILIITTIFYLFYFQKPSQISLWGTNKIKSLLFPFILITGYSIKGIENSQGINPHFWAAIFCVFTLIYDLMEEYTWRGYLYENLNHLNLILKSIITGIFWGIWHLLIFNDFQQYGGFFIFLLFCIIFSFLLNYSIKRTHSLLVAATLHALLIRTNEVTGLCLVIFIVILITWNNKFSISK